MKASFSTAAALAATFSIFASAASSSQPTCGGNKNCPSDTPCCSQYGQCGVGAYCLGGCNPQNSFDLESCVAAPVCKSQDYQFNDLSGVVANSEYLGDSSKADWVSSGTPVEYNDDSVLLTMAPNTVGTLLMSTHYVWYGKISSTLTTSQGAGVVTAFIMMSDVKDEIDFEFVGVDLQNTQSNYYFQGITDYDNEQNLTASSTVSDAHTYTIDWQPDVLTWSVDGNVLRTKYRNETYNTTTQQYHYPQSPARVELSLWPAGLASNGEGTVGWAGGLVDWDSPYMQNGYYYARVYNVSVECYNPPSGFSNNHGSDTYYYTSTYGTNDSIAIGNNSTELASFYASGDNPSYCPSGCSSSASGTASAKSTKTSAAAMNTAGVNTIPGISGGGNAGNSGSTESTDTSGNSNSNSASGSTGSSSSSGSSGGGSNSFDQGMGGSSSSQASKVFAGSAVALLGFIIAALMI